MGDRCYMQVTCRKQDVEAFEESDYYSFGVTDEGEKLVKLDAEEVNYGNTDNLPMNLPFVGWHSEGGEYGGYAFACDGKGRFSSVAQGHGNDDYVVMFDEETGEPDQGSLETVKEFIQFRNQVRKMMEETSVEPEEDDEDELSAEEKFPISDWKQEVANGDTKLGYEDWLKHRQEAEA